MTIGSEAEIETDTILHAGAEEMICDSIAKMNCPIAVPTSANPQTFDRQEDSTVNKHYGQEIDMLCNSNLADDCCNSIKNLQKSVGATLPLHVHFCMRMYAHTDNA